MEQAAATHEPRFSFWRSWLGAPFTLSSTLSNWAGFDKRVRKRERQNLAIAGGIRIAASSTAGLDPGGVAWRATMAHGGCIQTGVQITFLKCAREEVPAGPK